ncbi:MAG: HAMP domain-containing histidine kinase [Thermoflexales bacterium]|nr:HAMP domain-containing histidine kinase [Thermoflexales bacterium]
MMRSLRAKLAASHSLPILLLLPILSLYLFYVLEDFFVDSLLQQLTYQANLLSHQVEQQPELLDDPQAAQTFLASVAPLTDGRVVILSTDSVILASTRQDDDRVGTRYADQAVEQALQGESVSGIAPGSGAEVAFVVVPLERDGAIAGAMRVSYEVNDLRSWFSQLQGLVLVGVLLVLLLGVGIGLGLATTITQPLRQLDQSARGIAAGEYHARVNVQSRDEVGTLARSFNQMAERLEEAEQARGRQLAVIVHELARPLTGMQAAIETLRDGADAGGADADGEMRAVLLGGIEQELARLDRLIGTLQGMHKLTLHPLQLNRAKIGLERVIRACVVNYEPAAAQLGLTLSVEIPPRLPRVSADEDRVIQVLTNLLDNALKFTPSGGSVTVQARRKGGAVAVTVADTGEGITAEELPHIFQQFYSGQSRPPEKRGMGLGLALCREIVTAHGGQITVESQPGQGARFTFTLPK